jgi:hypothetical protein
MIGKIISNYKIIEKLPDVVGTSGKGSMPSIAKNKIAWFRKVQQEISI